MVKQEATLPMSCHVVLKVTIRQVHYPQRKSLPATVTHEGAANGGVVLRFHGFSNRVLVLISPY
jgi:hypothetical protein